MGNTSSIRIREKRKAETLKAQRCECCDALLNDQPGFEDAIATWTCTECGSLNYIDFNDPDNEQGTTSQDDDPTLLGNIAAVTENLASLAGMFADIQRTFHSAEDDNESDREDETAKKSAPEAAKAERSNTFCPPPSTPIKQLYPKATVALMGICAFLLMAYTICPDDLIRFFSGLSSTVTAFTSVIFKVAKGLVDFFAMLVGRIFSAIAA